MFVYYTVILESVVCAGCINAPLEETKVRLSDIPVATGLGIVSTGCVGAILTECVGPHDTSGPRGPILLSPWIF